MISILSFFQNKCLHYLSNVYILCKHLGLYCIKLTRGLEMKLLKSIVNILILFFVLSCTMGAAMAADGTKGTYKIVDGNGIEDADNNRDSDGSANHVKGNGGLSADQIYSDKYVLGQTKGDSSTDSLFNINNWIASIKAFPVLWAIIELAFALVGALILILYPGSILLNAVKKIIASKGENADQAVRTIKELNNKDMAVTTGVGLSLCLLSIAMFIVSLA